MANIADFLLWAIWPPPRLFEDSETPAWLGLSMVSSTDFYIGGERNGKMVKDWPVVHNKKLDMSKISQK